MDHRTDDRPGEAPQRQAPTGMRAEVRRSQAAVLAFYGLDGLLLTLLGWVGTVQPLLGLCSACAGLVCTQAIFRWFWRTGATDAALDRLPLLMTASAGLVMLSTLAAAPQVGGIMLMSIMAVLALSAVQMPRRLQLAMCALLGAGAVVVLSATGNKAGFPTETQAERAITAFWLVPLMAKASAHNIYGTKLRQQVKQGNEDLAAALESLERVALTDDLTGLPNRRSILATVEQAMTAAAGPTHSVAIALLDIDHFKRVNDRCGHEVGDRVLQEFGRVVSQSLRPTDRVGRYGGEEFLLLMCPLDSGDEAAAIAQRLCNAIAEHDWSRLAPGLHVTASIGVATPVPGEAVAQSVARADARLYQAKAEGRNRVVASTPVGTHSPVTPCAAADRTTAETA